MASGGGGGQPPNSGGEFLLQLLQKPQQQRQQTQNPRQHHHYIDPAVGPTLAFQSNGHHPQPPQWLNHHPTPNNNTPWGLAGLPPPPNLHSTPDYQQLGANGRHPRPHQQLEEKNMIMFGSLPTQFRNHHKNVVGDSRQQVVEPRKPPPPGFPQKPKNSPGSVPALDIEQSLTTLHEQDARFNRRRDGPTTHQISGKFNRRRDEPSGPVTQMSGRPRNDNLSVQLMDSVRLSIGLEKNAQNNADSRDKDFKSDIFRELQPPGHRMKNHKRVVDCRSDIDKMNAPFLAIFNSLVPTEEEKAKQKQLLTSLEKLVIKEWPKSRLYLYGSCANSFGVSNSDIDVCLAIEGEEINKSELLLRLADILKEDNLQNVQALTRARVPIVKLMDPVTKISCDICVNNVLAVVNTKLLRDYAEIDCRLRQLAFIVKHWAKSRGVNVTYQGTLSSYAYVLMCIHFLQQRRPAILPCLQGMEATYVVSVEDIECSYFDKVENLRDFGAQNKECIAQLVWAFFDYWAYRHDYSNAVISVRTGSIISKRAKDWTRRIGNDRHLICIEDPFEISHDLGRVVDKYSIEILRDEFRRAADIMQYDPDPCVTLFEPFVPES